jgi:hypothetical protein
VLEALHTPPLLVVVIQETYNISTHDGIANFDSKIVQFMNYYTHTPITLVMLPCLIVPTTFWTSWVINPTSRPIHDWGFAKSNIIAYVHVFFTSSNSKTSRKECAFPTTIDVQICQGTSPHWLGIMILNLLCHENTHYFGPYFCSSTHFRNQDTLSLL